MLAAKRLIQKAVHHHHHHHHHQQRDDDGLTSADLDSQIAIHYGIPSTASLLAFDSIQRLLAVATLDGRIKVIGGDGIEGLLVSPKQLPYKHLEFLQNQGFLVGVTNENDIQVWNLESRCLAYCLQWESNITAFAIIIGSYFMYIGDEHGSLSVVKYDVEAAKLVQLPYHISASSLTEAAGFASLDQQPIVGILSHPCSSGNRVLIAYENGLIILWDISEERILFVGGGKDLQLEDEPVDSQSEVNSNTPDDTSYHHLQEKEISALCWASSDGSILAVGYVDGDILFWKITSDSSSDGGGQQQELSNGKVVKLQLSSAERRLPVIVLHWSATHRSNNESNGQLFIYGGDEIGSEEVLTVLTLEWSRMETLRCVGRLDLTLTGSFADMILLSSGGPISVDDKASLFVLTNPGQLHFYDDACLSALSYRQEEKTPAFAVEFPAVVPMTDPPMTVSKFIASVAGGNSSKILSQHASVKKNGWAGGTKWPLTGGVPSQLNCTGNMNIERMYIAGYQDGSIRLWNASCPVLSLICILEGKVQDIKVADFGAPVSTLEFCFLTLSLAVGNECGLVRIYNLNSSSDETSFCFVTEAKYEDYNLPQGKGPHCKAVFSLSNSPIRVLQFAKSGAKLAVGFECGRVAMLDMSSMSILFFTDCLSGFGSAVISFIWTYDGNAHNLLKSAKHPKTDIEVNSAAQVLFVLTKDATICIIDGDNGSMISFHRWRPKKKSIALSMYVVESSSSVSGMTEEKQLKPSTQDASAKSDSVNNSSSAAVSSHDDEQNSAVVPLLAERSIDSLILLCCEDSLRLYSTKNVIQGNNKTICKVKHAKPCCWTSTLKKDDRVFGLFLLFPTGLIEVRSFPDLELVKESSLMSILRWKFKANMEKMMSSDDGQIALANGCELAFVSLLSGENCFRIPESFPCLHDKVLAAAAEAALSVSSNQKKKQVIKPGILGGIVKGFKGGKVNQTADITLPPKFNLSHLEGIFARPTFADSSPTATDNQEVVELNIDDIEIDEPPPLEAAAKLQEVKNIKKADKRTEREQLLGASDDTMPRVRTLEEIKSKYRKAADASSAAGQARNKLMERQEKLDRISKRTAELQSGAEDFASLANELVKTMENRKWWQI